MIKRLKKIFFRGFKRDRFQVITRSDGIFLANYSNYIDRKLIVDGAYERAQLDAFCGLVDRAGATVFLDIGANIGLYTVKVGSRTTLQAVHAFEPVVENRNQLHANVLLNRLSDKVNVYPYALSNASGQTAFLRNNGNSTGRSRIKETNVNSLDADKFSEVVVEIRVLDELLPISGSTVAIKIDVEGHELKVLSGMTGILKQNTCVVQLEAYPATAEEVAARMDACGYRLITKIGDDHYFTNAPQLN